MPIEIIDDESGPRFTTRLEHAEIVTEFGDFDESTHPWSSLSDEAKERWLDFLRRTHDCAVAEADDADLAAAVKEELAAQGDCTLEDVLNVREGVAASR
jgi:hypothetical protein